MTDTEGAKSMSILRVFIHPDDRMHRKAFFQILKRIGFEVYQEEDGTIRLIWDDDYVNERLSRKAGSKKLVHVRDDILIEHVLDCLDAYKASDEKNKFVQERFGISASTFRRRMRFFEEKYGSLQRAYEAGCVFFTNNKEING